MDRDDRGNSIFDNFTFQTPIALPLNFHSTSTQLATTRTMDSSGLNPEHKLVPIGRGSFATVSVLGARPMAFKHVIFPLRTPELKAEFEVMCSIYDFCNTDSFFAIPRPLAYYDPVTPNSFVALEASPISHGRQRARRPLVIEDDFRELNISIAAYAMDLVIPLPLSTATVIRNLFYPVGQENAPLPTLCRLYFGKTIDTGRPSRFFNSANFPLDVSRYTLMSDQGNANNYPRVDEIVHGMGEMLGRLHWRGGYDGRDIEFVMGGASFSGVAMNVIDFN